MNNKLLEYLPDPNSVKGGIAEAVEIIIEEAPLLVQELINWKITIHGFWWLFSLFLVLTICFIVFTIGKKWTNKGKLGDFDDRIGYGMIIPLLLAVIWLIPLFINFTRWLKVIIAPKVFLLEYFRELIG